MRSLKIQNLIFIEKEEILFDSGLNILTGETGSGKSAILSAIRLIAGERADINAIRKGKDFAVVEATLEDGTIIRREIYRSGKNRCFIDEAQSSLSDLKKHVNIELVDQNSSHKVLTEKTGMLDSFAKLTSKVKILENSFQQENFLKKELEIYQRTPKERELDWAKKDLELIENCKYQEGIEAKLSEEHARLIHIKELLDKVGKVGYLLTEDSILSNLKKALLNIDSCLKFDPSLKPISDLMKSSILELSEAGNLALDYVNSLELDPNRLEKVEEQIGAIESLKKRFGNDIEASKKSLQKKIDELQGMDEKIEEIKKDLQKTEHFNQLTSLEITKKRKEAAIEFGKLVLIELKSLNLPFAEFIIDVGNEYGDVQFLFSANLGAPPSPIEACASGGELSRLLLAIKTVMVDGNSTLVFDEIDSNVGGNTASILGQKLMGLAKKRQVICVTHFVQVAKFATNHILVSKMAKEDQTYTTAVSLSENDRRTEYERMLGNSK